MRGLFLSVFFSFILSTAVHAQTQFFIFPGTRFCTEAIPHTAIFSRRLILTAGTTNVFTTAGTKGWFLQGGRPDPVMLLMTNPVPTAGTIVAFNDDFVAFDSLIAFTPATTGIFLLIVHSFSTSDAGFTTVLHSVNGAPPTTLATNTKFGGTHVLTDWNSGIRFDTAGGNGDTVLLLRSGTSIGSTLHFSDDIPRPNFPPQSILSSSITPTMSGHGGRFDNPATRAIVGSFSGNVEGQTTLCQSFRSWMSPLRSPPQDAPTPAPVPDTPEMKQFIREYEGLKPKLADMDSGERDQAILALQRRVLPESQIRTFSAPPSYPTVAHVRAQNEFLARAHERDPELAKLDHDRRAAELDQMKAETVGRALLLVEPDYGIPLEP